MPRSHSSRSRRHESSRSRSRSRRHRRHHHRRQRRSPSQTTTSTSESSFRSRSRHSRSKPSRHRSTSVQSKPSMRGTGHCRSRSLSFPELYDIGESVKEKSPVLVSDESEKDGKKNVSVKDRFLKLKQNSYTLRSGKKGAEVLNADASTSSSKPEPTLLHTDPSTSSGSKAGAKGAGRPVGASNKRIKKEELESLLQSTRGELEEVQAQLQAAKSHIVVLEAEKATIHQPLMMKPPGGLRVDVAKRMLPNVDGKYIEMVLQYATPNVSKTKWADVVGLNTVKNSVKETVVYPRKRPDLFTGPRSPSNGIILYGPPGTGKTMIARCIASELGENVNFFSLTAASVGSKWVGESENIIRTFFEVARTFPPSIIFIDEAESVFSARNSKDGDTARKMKTEFIAQMDGIADHKAKPLVIAATNRPQDIDSAVLRRLPQKLYIPLPDQEARKEMLQNFMEGIKCNITDSDFNDLAVRTDLYSGSDLKNLVREAAMEPIREVRDRLDTISPEDIRGVTKDDVYLMCTFVKSSINANDINQYEDFQSMRGGF